MAVIPDETLAALEAQYGLDRSLVLTVTQGCFPESSEVHCVLPIGNMQVCEMCGALVVSRMRYTHAVHHAIATTAFNRSQRGFPFF